MRRTAQPCELRTHWNAVPIRKQDIPAVGTPQQGHHMTTHPRELTAHSKAGASAGLSHEGPMASDESFQMPRLLHWLYRAGAQRGHGRAEVARHLGVTYGYLNQLTNGTRLTHNVSSDFCRACARYLDVPAVVVMVAARRITMEDFGMPRTGMTEVQRHQQRLAEGLHRIADDPLIGCLLPPEVWDTPDSVKTLLLSLYEDATKQELFPPRGLPMFFQALQDAALLVDEQDSRYEADFLARQPEEGEQ